MGELAMGESWAARFPEAEFMSAGALRLFPEVQAGEQAGDVWLRGPMGDEALVRAVRKLPGAIRYKLHDDGQLFPWEGRLPCGRIPRMAWAPFAEWLVCEPQAAALAGEVARRAAFRVVRTAGEREATVLVTDLDTWVAFSLRAAAVRLRPLSFAVAADRRTVVRGRPLPPIQGVRYAERDGIAVPCGFEIWPPLGGLLLQLLQLAPGDLALFDVAGTYEPIRGEHFVAATRSAARLTRDSVTARLDPADEAPRRVQISW
jgi:hypothetical protein